MQPEFQRLSDKFANLDPNDGEASINFYESNVEEIEKLPAINTGEELGLAAAIHHTYGRSLFYLKHDAAGALKHLNQTRDLIQKPPGKV